MRGKISLRAWPTIPQIALHSREDVKNGPNTMQDTWKLLSTTQARHWHQATVLSSGGDTIKR